MRWNLSGELIEACSCKSACPCVLGPAEPDQGWCSGALTFVIREGESDGVSLAGRTVVWLVDLPGDFAGGDGTVRLYIDNAADAAQCEELEAIFAGRKGGPGAVLGSLVSTWLPTEKAAITTTTDDNPSITVGTVGHVQLQMIADEAGRKASVHNAPILGAIQIDRADLARGDGSHFADPDMRRWESGGHGSVSPFTWQA